MIRVSSNYLHELADSWPLIIQIMAMLFWILGLDRTYWIGPLDRAHWVWIVTIGLDRAYCPPPLLVASPGRSFGQKTPDPRAIF